LVQPLKSAPSILHLASKLKKKTIFLNLPLYGPLSEGRKRMSINLGGQFLTLRAHVCCNKILLFWWNSHWSIKSNLTFFFVFLLHFISFHFCLSWWAFRPVLDGSQNVHLVFNSILNPDPHNENRLTPLHVRTRLKTDLRLSHERNRSWKSVQNFILFLFYFYFIFYFYFFPSKNQISSFIESRSSFQILYITCWLLLLFFSRGATSLFVLLLLFSFALYYFSLFIVITLLPLLFFFFYCYYLFPITLILFLLLLLFSHGAGIFHVMK
jgi:hypothetical protein